MKKWKIYFGDFTPNKKNGNPKFWAFTLIPCIGFMYMAWGDWHFHIDWLFWDFNIESKGIE